ncbi:MAG: hypothetical protein RJQ05_05860 [Cytophagales bacterium]
MSLVRTYVFDKKDSSLQDVSSWFSNKVIEIPRTPFRYLGMTEAGLDYV